MGSTKFVVVKAKELIKTAVFAVLGVIILVGLITFFLHMGDEENTGMYRDGTYYGEMELGGEMAEIAVEIGISRQGVRELIKKAEEELRFYEEKLGLAGRFRSTQRLAEQLIQLLKDAEVGEEVRRTAEELAETVR